MALVAKTGQDDRPEYPTPASVKQIAEWMAILCRGERVEVRAINVEREADRSKHTETSVFPTSHEQLLELARYARNLTARSEGVYFTLNPIAEYQGKAAKDANVERRTWLLFDLDPVRPSDVSSTDHEKLASYQAATTLRRALDELGWPEPILADSGNGWHLLYHVDLPADDSGLVAAVLKAVSARYSTELVKVDTTVGNASRICKLYGTIARKGEHTAERPHRTAWIMEATWPLKPVPSELLEAIAGTPALPPAARQDANAAPERPVLKVVSPRRGIIARDLGESAEIAYGLRALGEEIDRIRFAAPGGRNHQLFKSAAALFELVAAGALGEGEVLEALKASARLAGLEAPEIEKTIDSARKKGIVNPRDMSHVGQPTASKTRGPALVERTPEGVEERLDDPHRLARTFLQGTHTTPEGMTLRYWNEEWVVWKRKAWRSATDKEINALLARVIKAEFDRIAREKEKPALGVGTRLVGNVALALRGMTLLTMDQVPQQPTWIDGPGPNPVECLPTQSGIVHLPTLLASGPAEALIPSTPRFFSPNVLTYGFDARAPRPDAWLGFLQSLWPDDEESIRCLQQWFGYLLTPDTRQQKMLLIIGPRRSGKGTITRTLKELVGEANVAAPTLSSLGGRFGSQPLIGKTLAICTESRLTGRSDTQAIVERLLSISGEDVQSIERKQVTNWSGTLSTRFVLMGNELPRLGDYSGALPGRMIVLKLTRSFFGQEDMELQSRIAGELPGILLWAIAGWEDLRKSGRLIQPKSGEEAMTELEALANPIGAFLAEKCEIRADFEVRIQDMYEAWKDWCKATGKDHPGDLQGFARNVRTAVPDIKTTRPRGEKTRPRYFEGIRLIGDWT